MASLVVQEVEIPLGWMNQNSTLISSRSEFPHSETKAIETDKTGGIIRVVITLRPFHGGDGIIIQGVGRLTAYNDAVAFVELEACCTGNGFLTFVKEGLEGFPFGSIPEAIIYQLGILGG